jgi:hypothetical protein
MKALAQLGMAAHIAIAILVTAILSGQAAYRTLYPGGPISAQQYADLTYHPYASLVGAMTPGVIAGLVAFAALRWPRRKVTPKFPN